MTLDDVAQFCESPIEARLARALADVFRDGIVGAVPIVVRALKPLTMAPYSQINDEGVCWLIPQATIDEPHQWRYRVDFLLVCGPRYPHRRMFAIECDGHDWHEKTKEQVARDKRRDRDLLAANITAVRFSGSEIHAAADECADYIATLAHGTVGNILWDLHVLDCADKSRL